MGDQVEEHDSKRRIAIAVDRSEESLDALKWALEKVCRSSDKLVVLHVTSSFEEPNLSEMDFMFHRSPTAGHLLDDLYQQEEAAALALAQKCKKLADQAHVSCETIIKEGDAREVICSFVLEYQPDLLMVGSRGPATILNRALLGSVSEYVVRHAQCPVLVARPTRHTLEERRQKASRNDAFALSSWVWGEQPDLVEDVV